MVFIRVVSSRRQGAIAAVWTAILTSFEAGEFVLSSTANCQTLQFDVKREGSDFEPFRIEVATPFRKVPNRFNLLRDGVAMRLIWRSKSYSEHVVSFGRCVLMLAQRQMLRVLNKTDVDSLTATEFAIIDTGIERLSKVLFSQCGPFSQQMATDAQKFWTDPQEDTFQTGRWDAVQIAPLRINSWSDLEPVQRGHPLWTPDPAILIGRGLAVATLISDATILVGNWLTNKYLDMGL
ncbi:hypothetical protein GNI_056210 [Gregarina niphandrodes]|uniref:Uncharacterized protein n=1 Tax=Gregarina niphandrodes TaxID=110365 RepID=A0A023B8U2_GRENI|nr:hypothetical protein GNI_056210 [Gregarina niphandrodes]EZG70298.1 hypothetical protein GNI_056210 [Gregarina niphandrodes]|eukprot:XP_011129960.1 hypothetical protein GNI_056210 [Gregarina niphandrodes]